MDPAAPLLVFPERSALQPTYIYHIHLSITRSVLEETVRSGASLTSSAYAKLASLRSVTEKGLDEGRLRPCVVVPNPSLVTAGTNVIMPLTKLEGFHPSLLCAREQHFLVPTNDMPPWPPGNPLKVKIHPHSDSEYGYILACPRKPPFEGRHYGQVLVDGEPMKVSIEDASALARWGSRLFDEAHRWSGGRKYAASMSWDTHDKFLSYYRKVEAKPTVTAGDLREVDRLYNAHMIALAHARNQDPPERMLTPPEALPAESNLRWYLATRLLRPFNDEYPHKTTHDVQSAQVKEIQASADVMRQNETHRAADEEVLARLLLQVIRVAIQVEELAKVVGLEVDHPPVVHAAFTLATEARLVALLRRDAALHKVLEKLWAGTPWPAYVLLNYVYQARN